jgi:hypothetical protein
MTWLLVWWVIHPGHAQIMHLEHYDQETACIERANDLLANGNIRARCNRE